MKKSISQLMISLFLALAVGAGFESMILQQEFLWKIIPSLFIFVFISSLITSDITFHHMKRFSHGLFLLIVTLGIIGNLFTTSNPITKQALIILSIIIYFILFAFLSRQDIFYTGKERLNILFIDIDSMIHLITLFFIIHGFVGLYTFTRQFQLLILGLLFILITIQGIVFFMKHSIGGLRMLFYVIIVGLIVTEMAWVLFLWPIHYSSLSLILTLCSFLFCVMIYKQETHNINRKFIGRYILFVSILVLLVLGTSRWFPY